MKNASAVKRQAKTLLSGEWSRALAILCFVLFAAVSVFLVEQICSDLLSNSQNLSSTTYVIDAGPATMAITQIFKYLTDLVATSSEYISVIFVVIWFVLASPLLLGETMWYYYTVTSVNSKVSIAFSFYNSNKLFSRALIFKLNYLLRQALFFVICLIPSAVVLGLSYYFWIQYTLYPSDIFETNMIMLGVGAVLFAVIGLVAYAVVMIRFLLAEYLFIEQPSQKMGEVFKTSRMYMKDNVGRVVALFVSLIPQYLSCLLLIPVLYSYPFIKTAWAKLAYDIINEREGGAEKKKDAESEFEIAA